MLLLRLLCQYAMQDYLQVACVAPHPKEHMEALAHAMATDHMEALAHAKALAHSKTLAHHATRAEAEAAVGRLVCPVVAAVASVSA